MAQTTQDITLVSDSTGKEVKAQVAESAGGLVGVAGAGAENGVKSSPPTIPVAEAGPHVEKTSPQSSTDAQSNGPPPRPSLVPLGSSNTQSATLTPVAPHPKRFSAVNINKKFLEKNTASGSATPSSSSSTTKAGSAAARPSVQPTSSHSRLVTAKLTASPAVTSSTGGWSRPSSVAPSPGPVTGSPISTSPLPTLAAAQPSMTSAPQLPHAGKVILPQPRATLVQTTPTPKDPGPVKPVWGNVKPPAAVPLRPDIQPSDFPTAAEVAHSATSAMLKQNKADEAKTTSDTAAKQLRLEEADAFRGIHLDPNAHHWDEEEDDDNFLDGVIEFGDGRQYKIESGDSQQSGLSAMQGGSLAPPRAGEAALKEPSSGPVTKEERFVDDFDRSWPKSRTSPASISRDFPPPATSHTASPSISPVISHAAHSPQDSSRVLFNERSNRLEPYSQTHRPGQGPFAGKRPGFPDGPNTADPRSARDGPQNIQVLQKPGGGDFGARSRRFSSSSGNYNAGPANGFAGDRNRERDQPGRRDVPPLSPRLSRDQPPHVIDSRDRGLGHDRGRRNTNEMGPPPLPAHAQKHAQEGGRQLPPHLSQVSPNVPTRRPPSRDSRNTLPEPPLSATLPPLASGRPPSQSPAVSHKSLAVVSPVVAPNIALPLSAPEIDEARKGLMHTAAERAKQRRQQEEAEREAQKERARRKAAELEEKLKAEAGKQKEAEIAKLNKDKEVISIIEDALKSVEPATKISERTDSAPSRRTSPIVSTAQPQLSSDAVRPNALRRTSTIPSRPPPLSAMPQPATPASQTESWRARTSAVPPVTPRQIQARTAPTTNFVDSGPSAAEHVETIADGSKDDLEVVDFSELGKFVGVADAPGNVPMNPEVSLESNVLASRSLRPVAADFFEEPMTLQDAVPASKKADFGVWRRKVSQDANDLPLVPPLASTVKVDAAVETRKPPPTQTTGSQDRISTNKDQTPMLDASFAADSSLASTKEPLVHLDNSQGGQIVHVSPSSNAQRTPRSQTSYKEATMSTLDDTMSRIKGALMHVNKPTKESSKEVIQGPPIELEVPPMRTPQVAQPPQQTPSRPFQNNRWVPPALRPRRFDDNDEPREIFLYTVLQPPPSPTIGKIAVKLPSVSRPGEPISKKLLHAFSRPPYPARMDVMSFEPFVPDMNRREWSLNDVLFGKVPTWQKGKFKYRVWLPRIKGPRVSIPNATLAKPNGAGAFGRSTVADGASTWRKPVVSPATAKVEITSDDMVLNTTSRSPPPDSTPPLAAVTSIPKTSESSPAKSDTNQAVRSRSQPKMPEGSAVAFRRDSRIDVVEADTKPLVNFIIGSQLEERKTSPQAAMPDNAPTIFNSGDEKTEPPKAAKAAVNGTTSDHDNTLIFASIKTESKSSDESTDAILVTPPTHHSTASWARSSVSLHLKDSPARAPDPEHLKAVWSQTSNKAGLHAVNSLEGIADDLTALPFTLQDVKSEDGETPPPILPSAPSRMSLHEVTRAFQTVPTSSSTSSQPSHRPTFSPPSTQAPVARPTTASYAYSPASPANMRPTFVPYPSPMMSHSPAPVMYGHPHPMASSPVPSRMQVNGHTPLYSQPMWMTMPGPSQQHGSMMRPVPSPYPAQMMSYPSPGYVPQPPPNMMPATPQGVNGNRGRSMPVMSPVISHAHAHPGQPMYGGSPVMLHAVQVPQNHGYMPIPAGRGQPRTENGHMPPQQHPPLNVHPQSHGGFNPGSASPFVRPTW